MLSFRILVLYVVLLCPDAHAERYITWTDEEGNVRIKAVDTPAEQSVVEGGAMTPPISEDADTSSESKSSKSEGEGSVEDEERQDSIIRPSHNEADRANSADKGLQTEPTSSRPLGDIRRSPDVSQPLSSSPNAPTLIPSREIGATTSQNLTDNQPSEPSDTLEDEIDEGDYIDAEELEKQGFRRQSDKRFYTVIDESGRPINIPYPEDSELAPASPIEGEDAAPQIMAQVQSRQVSERLESADPNALALLGLDKAEPREIDQMAEACCKKFADFDTTELEEGKGLTLEVDQRDYYFQFPTGASRFRLITLSDLPKREYILRLRSYAQPEMFYPVVLTLDSDFQPLRYIQQILYQFEPEDWFNYAHLEGYFTIDTSEEGYLLLLTTEADVNRRTVVEQPGQQPVIIPHAESGILHLKTIEESPK